LFITKFVRQFDWESSIEGRFNLGQETNFTLIEGYLKAKLDIFQIKAGRSKDVMGLNGDTTLTSGNFSISGNALGIPNLELAIPEYYRIPALGGILSFKGNLSHGWLGKIEVIDTISENTISKVDRARTYFHQKSLYIRVGKEDWKINLYGGFNHQVFWGNEREIYGDNFDLSNTKTFWYVLSGKAYGKAGIPKSKIGNQLGSIDLGIDYNFENFSIQLYRQNFYDVGALAKLANIRDGLNGIVLRNKAKQNRNFNWNTIILEFLYTKNQAGEVWSKKTKSGDENYYNNYFYINGWSYKKFGLGTPFISTRESTRTGLPSYPDNFFINNRVVAFHTGSKTSYKEWSFITKLSFSKNYGTYGTSVLGHSTGTKRHPPKGGVFEELNQFSGFLQVSKEISLGTDIGVGFAADRGKLLKNTINMGGMDMVLPVGDIYIK